MRPLETLRAHREKLIELAASRRLSNLQVYGGVARDDEVSGRKVEIVADPADDATLDDIYAFQDSASALLGFGVTVRTYNEREYGRPIEFDGAVPL